jgi:hypothetical protein
MLAITVSTNYDDILKIIIPENYKFFTKWYIVTDKNDEKTIKLIKEFNIENIIIVYYDFFSNSKKFNKGGAIRHVQENIIQKLNYTGNILLLDSDVILPYNFIDNINKIDIKYNTLYGAEMRFDFYSLENLKNKKEDFKSSAPFQGYFQLYKWEKHLLYNDSYNCSECDLEFCKLFKQRIMIKNLHVCHLGKNGVNWSGRVDKTDFK